MILTAFAVRTRLRRATAALAASLLLVPCAGAQVGDVLFPSPTKRVVPQPDNLAVGDFDGDGLTDVATTTYAADTLTIQLGQPDGTLATGGSFAIGPGPTSMAVADFDADGDLDIATGAYDGNAVSVVLGAGDGTFGPHVEYTTISHASQIVAGDFNGDGTLDLAARNVDPVQSLAVLLGAGDGSFAHAFVLTIGASAHGMVAADLDGDGRDDLALSLATDEVRVLLASGSGTLTEAGTYATGDDPYAVVAADFDQDGYVDLATGNAYSGTVSILLGTADISFPSHQELPTVSAGSGEGPNWLTTADFDGDGLTDLLASEWATGRLTVFTSHGDGQFSTLGPYHGGYAPLVTQATDVNADGNADVVYIGTDGLGGPSPAKLLTVGVLLGNGDGTLKSDLQVPVSYAVNHLATADFDGDGRTDIATSLDNPKAVWISLGKGDGTFADNGYFTASTTPPGEMALADFDGDGALDIATVIENISQVVVLLGDGHGTFAAVGSSPVAARPVSLAAGDFDEDGALDLVTADMQVNKLSVLLGHGDGTFEAAIDFGAGGDSPTAVVAEDFTGDGHLDLAVTLTVSSRVVVFPGDGTGSFGSPIPTALDATPLHLAVGDFDQDGVRDLATVSKSTWMLDVLLGQGDGTFDVAVYPVAPNTRWPTVGDFDGDGVQDLAASNGSDNTVLVLLGQGDGTFAVNGLYGTMFFPMDLATGDLLIDGRQDLISAHAYGGSATEVVTVLPNVAPSAWTQVGHALAGDHGAPSLYGTGTLAASSIDGLHVAGAAPSALGGLVLGFDQALLSFKGGVLVPTPQLVVTLPTTPEGRIDLPFAMPAGVPTGLPLVLQAWIADTGAPAGYAASNGLVGLTP